ncbi:C-C motif chemokine 4-like [Carettochelys insculpta]|uniref:C-C motif chemokine 4-like n=1 Tax=Carettochelys insculpta TaxID=44489 RepID=UPI003EC0CEA8
MKVPVAALAMLLSTACCSLTIPLRFLVGYFDSDSTCSQPAVVFVTKKGHKICANPNEAWVRQNVNFLDGL